MTSLPNARTVLAAALLATAATGAFAQWKPTHPINLIVPWAAGGSTDQVTHVTAAEMEKALGQTIVIVNQPGASGSIGTRSALEAAKDGYTWTAGAAQKAVFPAVQANAWMLFENGKTKVSPDTVGIPKP